MCVYVYIVNISSKYEECPSLCQFSLLSIWFRIFFSFFKIEVLIVVIGKVVLAQLYFVLLPQSPWIVYGHMYSEQKNFTLICVYLYKMISNDLSSSIGSRCKNWTLVFNKRILVASDKSKDDITRVRKEWKPFLRKAS